MNISILYHPFNYGTPHQKERGDHALWKGKRLMRSHDRRGDTGFMEGEEVDEQVMTEEEIQALKNVLINVFIEPNCLKNKVLT